MTKHPWNKLTSWGCVQAFLSTLTILLLLGPGGALIPIPGVDLLEELKIHTNISEYHGVTITQDYQQRIYHLSGKDRKLVLPTSAYHHVAELLKRSPDFTFAAYLKQEQANSGTIISFSYGYNRYLELQSSGRRDEIRFHFSYMTPAGKPETHIEAFPYRLADDQWHKIALSISGTEIQLIIDCHPLYKKVTHFIPDRNFSASNMQLFVGQRNSDSHSLFKGDMQDVRIIPGPYGYLQQCEHLDTQCPTCSQFLQLENALVELRQHLLLLTQRLVAAESRISYVEECDCKKSCSINGTTRNDGESWQIGCQKCQCNQGVVTCGPVPCDKNTTSCKNPHFPVEGACCPVCKRDCLINGILYDDGERRQLGCSDCECVDGNMKCTTLECPVLTCKEEDQIREADECCKFCKDRPDERKVIKKMPAGNETLAEPNKKHKHRHGHGKGSRKPHNGPKSKERRQRNQHKNKHKRQKLGKDIDECEQQGGVHGNHCHLKNTRCVNTFGSYECECLPGYRRENKFACTEIDECATNKHSCDKNADCINTLGSYHCRCKEGYEGDGYECKPICKQKCLNGGRCSTPNVCTCRKGYAGDYCEKDLDECADSSLNDCKNTSLCVNMPGWYYCKCKSGFETKGNDCVDINECYLNTHSCHPTAKCVNTVGHFECVCPKERGANCRLSCMFEDNEIPDGGEISPVNQPCKICTCTKGVISCRDRTCNCSEWSRGSGRDLCCPQCDPNESCQHQELKHVTFRSGEQWIYQCQTCECLYGEFDCWKLECPPLTCNNPLPLQPGDCCPRCPGDELCDFDNSTIGNPCSYEKHIYASGQTFKYPSKECATCSCKNGKISCHYDDRCSNDELRKIGEITSIDSVKDSYSNSKSSKTTTAETLSSEDAAKIISTKSNTSIITASVSARQKIANSSEFIRRNIGN